MAVVGVDILSSRDGEGTRNGRVSGEEGRDGGQEGASDIGVESRRGCGGGRAEGSRGLGTVEFRHSGDTPCKDGAVGALQALSVL